MADDGYQSDTGPRDIPTCDHFLNGQPVKRTILISGNQRALNRKGRAICRIMERHGWPGTAIARIFQVGRNPVYKAITNDTGQDDASKDYDCVDAAFRVHFPPRAERSKPLRKHGDEEDVSNAARPHKKAKLEDEAEKPDDDVANSAVVRLKRTVKKPQFDADGSAASPRKRSAGNPTLARRRSLRAGFDMALQLPPGSLITALTTQVMHWATRVGKSNGETDADSVISPTPEPSPPPMERKKAQKAVHTGSKANLPPIRLRVVPPLASFLKTGPSVDLTCYCSLLADQGFTVSSLNALARWDCGALEEALVRLLARFSGVEGGMSAYEIVALEIAIRKLSSKSNFLLPSTDTHTTLPTFLEDVCGFDLALHVAFIEAQGFTLSSLLDLGNWQAQEMREVLHRSLQRGGSQLLSLDAGEGMTPLEVLVLEFAICGRGWGRGPSESSG